MTNAGFPQVVLAGLESVGKSALFRGLTGHMTGDEANFRGSTVVCRKCHLHDCGCDVVDTPGIRLQGDLETTRIALSTLGDADVVLLVARGTHAVSEIETLLKQVELGNKKSALAFTFQDRAPAQIHTLAELYRRRLGIPVVVVNSRDLTAEKRGDVLAAIRNAAKILPPGKEREKPYLPEVRPQHTVFETPFLGPWLAVASMVLLFAAPVYLAYGFASWVQPFVDSAVIAPLKAYAETWPNLFKTLLTGGYGVITLGWYSFLWAFPVVLLMGLSTAFVEETGLKDRITAALDPWLRPIGLGGRDLVPVLSGFGCNVVAVFHSRACSRCTRNACLSMIGFASACSYQIGASLSIFSAAGRPGLFLPYLAALFVVGAVHTRLWHGSLRDEGRPVLDERSFLQKASMRAVGWRVRASVGQFLKQAMPIFLLLCVVAALLEHLGFIAWIAAQVGPVIGLLNLPGEAAVGIVFSILRKDGLLTLNHDGGSLIAELSGGQIFLFVWLGSTFSACLVTLWTVRRELGWGAALALAGRQSLTSVASTWLISRFV